MFARYEYNAGATGVNIANDIIAIFTGETNKANLSAACNQSPTYINSTNAAGWTVYDATAGTNAQVIRAINIDASTYKYLYIDVNQTFSNSIYVSGYESWNSGSHVGTNQIYARSDVVKEACLTVDLTNGGVIFIGSTTKYIFISGFQSGLWNAPPNYAGQYKPLLCFEFPRNDPFNTVGNGYPCWTVGRYSAYRGSGNEPWFFYLPRLRASGADGTGSWAGGFVFSNPGGPLSSRGIAANSTDRIHFFAPIYLTHPGVHAEPFGGSNVSGVVYIGGKIADSEILCSTQFGNNGDIAVYNSNEYWMSDGYYMTGGKLAIPHF